MFFTMKDLISEKSKTIKIGVDAGNSFTNVVAKDYYDVYSSCVTECFGSDVEDSYNTIAFNNHHFIVGQGELTAENVYKRDLDKYKALVLFAICSYLKKNNYDTSKDPVEIHLGIGIPTGSYADNRVLYNDLFDKQVFNCNFTGVEMNFICTEVRVVPQGTVIAAINKELFKDVSLGYLIDWGSFTVDIQKIVNGQIIKEDKKSYDLGTIKLLTDLSEKLKKFGGYFTDIKDIERVLMDREFVSENGIVKIFDNEEIYTFLKVRIMSIIDRIKRENQEINNSRRTVVVGGGGIVFKEFLEEGFINCDILENPEKLNSEYYYKFMGGK